MLNYAPVSWMFYLFSLHECGYKLDKCKYPSSASSHEFDSEYIKRFGHENATCRGEHLHGDICWLELPTSSQCTGLQIVGRVGRFDAAHFR